MEYGDDDYKEMLDDTKKSVEKDDIDRAFLAAHAQIEIMAKEIKILRDGIGMIWDGCMPCRKGFYPRNAARNAANRAALTLGAADGLHLTLVPSKA